MKRLVCMFSLWGVAFPLIATVLSPSVLAQEFLPILELPTATSAQALQGFDNRQTQTNDDFDLLPVGAGGEQSTDLWDYSLVDLSQIEDEVTGPYRTLPAYAVEEPNRSIETQTDPERLMIQMPTERRS